MKRIVSRFFAASAALFVFSALLSCATPGAAAERADLSAPVPFSPAVRTGTLPNGLRYYLRENARPEKRVLLRLFVDAGSVLETDEEQGLAHFVEHMAFNGTERFPKSALVDYLRSLGMRFGPELNAYTTFDQTVYGIEVPTEAGPDGARNVPERALQVMDDWTRAVRFEPEDVEAERSVILEEWRMGLGASDRVRRVLLPVLFEGSPYAGRLPIGLPEVVRSAPAERLAAFFRKWYRPDNLALVVVGDFDAERLEKGLAARFPGPAAGGRLDRPRFDLPPPERGRIAVAVAADPELGYGFVQLGYKRSPAPVGADLAAYRDALLEELVERMLGLRFLEETVKPETPYTGAGAGFQRYGTASRFLTLSAMAESGSVQATLRELLRAKERLVRFGFSERELESAKKALFSDLDSAAAEKDRQESDALADALGAHFLRNSPVPDAEWEAAAARSLLAGIGKAEIDAFARSAFAEDDLTVMLAAPDAERASLPGAALVRELVQRAAEERLEPPRRTAEGSADDIAVTPPPKGAVVSERRDEESGALVWDLSNGARVILKPTAVKNDEIAMTALARGGRTDASDADAVSAALSDGLYERSGVGPYSLPELARRLSGRRIDLEYSVGDYTRAFRGSSASADLETFFRLLHLSFAAPRVDEGAAAAYLERLRTLYSQRKETPGAVFADRIASLVSGGHPRFAPLTVERLAEASAEKALSRLKKDLAPGDFTFAFAGNLDVGKMRTLAETWLASLPGARSGRDWKDSGMRRPAGADEAVRKGRDEKSEVFMARYLPAPNEERTAMAAEGLTELLDIVLVRKIREKLGGVYSISAYASLGAAPEGELSLIVRFSCDPARAEELSAAVDAELASLASGGIDAGTFAEAVSALKKRREQSLQDNAFIASVLASLDVVHRRPLGRLYGYGASYDTLESGELSRMAAALLARERIRAVLYPER